MHHALALEVPGQRLPASTLILRSLFARGGLGTGVIAILVTGPLLSFGSRLPRLPSRREQRELILRELLALAGALASA